MHVDIYDAMMFGNITGNLDDHIEKVTRFPVWVSYPYGFIKVEFSLLIEVKNQFEKDEMK